MDDTLDDALDAALIDEFDADAPAVRPPSPFPQPPASRPLVPAAAVHYPSFDDAGGANSEQNRVHERYPMAQLDVGRASGNSNGLQSSSRRAPPCPAQPEAPVSLPSTLGGRSAVSSAAELPASYRAECPGNEGAFPPQVQGDSLPLGDAESGSSLKRLPLDGDSAADGGGVMDEQLRERRRAVELEMREFQARVNAVALALAGQTPHQQQMRTQREKERVKREEVRAQHLIERQHHREEAREERARERRAGNDRRASSSPPQGETESDEEVALAVE